MNINQGWVDRTSTNKANPSETPPIPTNHVGLYSDLCMYQLTNTEWESRVSKASGAPHQHLFPRMWWVLLTRKYVIVTSILFGRQGLYEFSSLTPGMC